MSKRVDQIVISSFEKDFSIYGDASKLPEIDIDIKKKYSKKLNKSFYSVVTVYDLGGDSIVCQMKK